jgi:hypothetical protein
MTDEKHEPDAPDEVEDPTLLPNREVMSLISPSGGGLAAGIIPIGPEPALPDAVPAESGEPIAPDQTLPSVE